jgi:hypothetical protein
MYTHKKKPYRAACTQWTASNTEEVMELMKTSGIEASPYGDAMMLRWVDPVHRNSRIDMFYPGMWLRIGENGIMKIMSDQEFKLKYEEL